LSFGNPHTKVSFVQLYIQTLSFMKTITKITFSHWGIFVAGILLLFTSCNSTKRIRSSAASEGQVSANVTPEMTKPPGTGESGTYTFPFCIDLSTNEGSISQTAAFVEVDFNVFHSQDSPGDYSASNPTVGNYDDEGCTGKDNTYSVASVAFSGSNIIPSSAGGGCKLTATLEAQRFCDGTIAHLSGGLIVVLTELPELPEMSMQITEVRWKTQQNGEWNQASLATSLNCTE
jgi:hypothetical protein